MVEKTTLTLELSELSEMNVRKLVDRLNRLQMEAKQLAELVADVRGRSKDLAWELAKATEVADAE